MRKHVTGICEACGEQVYIITTENGTSIKVNKLKLLIWIIDTKREIVSHTYRLAAGYQGHNQTCKSHRGGSK